MPPRRKNEATPVGHARREREGAAPRDGDGTHESELSVVLWAIEEKRRLHSHLEKRNRELRKLVKRVGLAASLQDRIEIYYLEERCFVLLKRIGHFELDTT
jgi:hypothetical protein